MRASKTILVAVTNDVSTDQRVSKVSNFLLEKGYNITVFGRLLSDSFEINRPYKIIRKKLWFNNKFLFYAEYNIRLLWHLLFGKYQYVLANDLDTLAACYLGSNVKKSTLIYDSHEFFTEVPELQERKFVKSFWKLIESHILPKLTRSFTVSNLIASSYQSKYKINMGVVRNLPLLNRNFKDEDVPIPTKNKFILYQGVLNPGRGIKPMIEALHFLKNIDLVIIGYGKVKNDLIEFAKSKDLVNRVHFIGMLPYNELHNYAKKASIGMVLEEPLGKSFEYSLPNKLFDFIHYGLPIIASPIPEVKKVIEQYKVGILIDNFNPKHIAEIVTTLLDDKTLRESIIQHQLIAKKELCWENESKNLNKYFD